MAGTWNQAFVWNHDGTTYPGWPKAVGTFVRPALADLDSDGDLEIIYSSDTADLYIWHHDGTLLPGWPYTWAGGTGNATHIQDPAVADIDLDGQLEIAAGTGQGSFTTVPHEFLSWEVDGTVRAGFPVATQYQEDGPAIGDLDGDGLLEIAFFDSGFQGQDSLYLVDSNGVSLPGWPVLLVEVGRSSIALGDLDGDGFRDVVVGGAQLDMSFSCVNPRIYALNHQGGSLAGFPIEIPFMMGFCPQNSSLALVDLDGDKDLEVVAKYLDMVSAYHGDGTLVSGFPYAISDDGVGQDRAPGAAFEDVDDDGDIEFLFASASGRVAYFDTAASTSPATRVWPMDKHDALGTSDLGLLGVFSDGFESGDTSHWSAVAP